MERKRRTLLQWIKADRTGNREVAFAVAAWAVMAGVVVALAKLSNHLGLPF